MGVWGSTRNGMSTLSSLGNPPSSRHFGGREHFDGRAYRCIGRYIGHARLFMIGRESEVLRLARHVPRLASFKLDQFVGHVEVFTSLNTSIRAGNLFTLASPNVTSKKTAFLAVFFKDSCSTYPPSPRRFGGPSGSRSQCHNKITAPTLVASLCEEAVSL